uniref:Uncharacterized protein n=1 Tax=Tetraselmis sp. GSL018 TaxID=582737 RepID=A0A061R0F7_9CHLO
MACSSPFFWCNCAPWLMICTLCVRALRTRRN